MLKQVDGNLLLLMIGLFICNQAIANTGLIQSLFASLKEIGFDINHPLSLYAVSAILSDLVGNNPAVMLLTP